VHPPSFSPLLTHAVNAPPRSKSGTTIKVSRRAPWWLRRRLQMGNRAQHKKSADRSHTLSDAPKAIFRRHVRLWKRQVRSQSDQLGTGQKYNSTRLLHYPLKASSLRAAKFRKLVIATKKSIPRAPKSVSPALPSRTRFNYAHINVRCIATPAKLANIIKIMKDNKIMFTLLSETATTGESSYSSDAFQVHIKIITNTEARG
jgi:hypothetical protein